MKKLLTFLLMFIQPAVIANSASIQYPADISYMVADLKYSKEHGVKICEVQHGVLSTFLGDVFLHGSEGTLCPLIAEVFAEFPLTKWGVGLPDVFAPLRRSLEKSADWKVIPNLETVLQDPEFLQNASLPPDDPYNIASYRGMMIYSNPSKGMDVDEFHKEYPGILVIERPTAALWKDKYKMSLLFTRNPLLAHIKPEWGIYPKQYSSTLAAQIIEEIPSDAYVIKPRSAFLGNGIIITSNDDLDKTLKYILTDKPALRVNKDSSYNYWVRDSEDSFIVEKYYPSDPIAVASLEDKLFEPTMRVAFIMIYNNQQIDFRFLGGYWILPHKSLEEEGSLNDRKKAYCKTPYFAVASSEVLAEVQKELEGAIPLFYKEMLEW